MYHTHTHIIVLYLFFEFVFDFETRFLCIALLCGNAG